MMRISAPGCCERRRGFTLIEVLVVLAIIALGSGLMTLSLQQSDDALLNADARALGRFFQRVASDAAASGHTLRVEHTAHRFEVSPGAIGQAAPPALTLRARVLETPPQSGLVFPPGGGEPFTLTLQHEGQHRVVARDALGRIAIR